MTYIGERLVRKEDRRLLTGRGRYIGDISLPGMLHVDARHRGARLREDVYQPLLLETQQRLSYRCLTDAELLRQLVLRHQRARGEAQIHDLLPQRLKDVLDSTRTPGAARAA